MTVRLAVTVRRMIGPSDGHRRRPPGATRTVRGGPGGVRVAGATPRLGLTATESVALAAADGSEYPGNHDHAAASPGASEFLRDGTLALQTRYSVTVAAGPAAAGRRSAGH